MPNTQLNIGSIFLILALFMLKQKKLKQQLAIYIADFIYTVDKIPEKYRHKRLIPRDASANHQDVARLVKIVECIEYEALRRFVARTLIQSRIMVPFL